ncbi:MAG: hypothetical protein AAF228_12215 [Pseudomonadota bacterium]
MNYDDENEIDIDIEDKEIAAKVFDTICSTLIEAGNTSEVDTSEKLLQLWVKVAKVIAETGEDESEAVLAMVKGPAN